MSRSFGFIPLTWTRIGDYSDGVGIYLCDQIVAERPFDQGSNDWDDSDIKQWLNAEFYNQFFSDMQKKSIVFNAEADASVFLLSAEEYRLYCKSIPVIKEDWWLRSPGYNTNHVVFVYILGDLVDGDDDLYGGFVDYNHGVRPAILMKEDV